MGQGGKAGHHLHNIQALFLLLFAFVDHTKSSIVCDSKEYCANGGYPRVGDSCCSESHELRSFETKLFGVVLSVDCCCCIALMPVAHRADANVENDAEMRLVEKQIYLDANPPFIGSIEPRSPIVCRNAEPSEQIPSKTDARKTKKQIVAKTCKTKAKEELTSSLRCSRSGRVIKKRRYFPVEDELFAASSQFEIQSALNARPISGCKQPVSDEPKAKKMCWEVLIRWQGYGSEHDSWEPYSNVEGVHCVEALLRKKMKAEKIKVKKKAKNSRQRAKLEIDEQSANAANSMEQS